jgi:hypothetical protein
MTTLNDDARSPSAEHPLAYASVSVYGDSLDPVFWTNYFGFTPDTVLIKGVAFTTPSGRPSKFPARTGAWGISSREAVVSNDLTPHIEYLVSKLLLPRPDLPKLLEQRGETMRCFCYWANYAGDRVPVIDPRLEAAIKESGGYIEIDEYK